MKLFKIMIILALVAGVPFILLEVGLNLARYNFSADALYQYNPDFSWTQLSNINYYYADHLFNINQDGFRDINHTKKNRPESLESLLSARII